MIKLISQFHLNDAKLITQLKPAHSPNRNQSLSSNTKLIVWFLRKGITDIKWIKCKSDADTKVLKTKFTETTVLRKHKKFYAEKNIATLKQVLKESLKKV